MSRHFYVLKASIVLIAVVIAGATTGGFQFDRLSSRVDAVHYSAAIYADCAVHQGSHAALHALGQLFGHLRG